LRDTLAAVGRLRAEQLDFIVQMSLTRGNRDEIGALAAWSAERGAVSFNVYFLVATGRGETMQGLTPSENEDVLTELIALERAYRGRMLVRSKCQPQIMRFAYGEPGTQSETASAQSGSAGSSLLNYGTRCPCGVSYCRITPEGKLTPCPYTPVVAGDLRVQSFGEVWRESPVFATLRTGAVGGKCGRCEYKEVCGGCRARAYADHHDLMAADDSCAYVPAGDRAPIAAPAVAYGAAPQAMTMAWSDEAKTRLERIPGFVRGVVASRIENFARERGFETVTAEVMEAVRREMPVDFSKKMPFFMRQ
jgi:radical SAM protein with 4Fe4S-binding SPASM domain